MTVSDLGQAKVFAINIIFGMLCVVLFDLFTAVRRRFEDKIVVINLLDGVYFSIAFMMVMYASIKFNFGAFRYYQVIGLLIGIVFQGMIFSRTERKLFDKILEISLRIVFYTLKIVLKPLLFLMKLFLLPFMFIENNTMKFLDKMEKRKKKTKKIREKNKKTVKKRIKML